MYTEKTKLKLILLTIMVMGFTGINSSAAAAVTGKSSPALTRTHWQLIELAGRPAPAGVRDKPVKMVLIHNCNDFRVRGFSGCNRFSTTFKQSSGQLQFSRPPAGRKTCKGFMELEEQFINALVRTEQYRIIDQSLSLFDQKHQPLLRFEAVKH